jgi:hypothetical protein
MIKSVIVFLLTFFFIGCSNDMEYPCTNGELVKTGQTFELNGKDVDSLVCECNKSPYTELKVEQKVLTLGGFYYYLFTCEAKPTGGAPE